MSPLWQWFAAVIANRRDPGGGGEGRGPVHNPPPPTPRCRSRSHVGAGPYGPVPGRGGGGGGGGGGGCYIAFPLGSPTSGPMGEDVRAAVPPRGMDYGWGDHPGWAVPCGPPGGVLVGGTRRVPGPIQSRGAETRLAVAGPTVVRRKISEDYGEALLLQLASGKVGFDPRTADRAGGAVDSPGVVRRGCVTHCTVGRP